MYSLRKDVENASGFNEKLTKALPQLSDILQIHDLYYVLQDNRMKAVLDEKFDEDASDLANSMEDDLFYESTLDLIKKHSPEFYGMLLKNGFESVLVARIRRDENIKGYLICAVKRSLRIWQENECAILYYLAELLADEI